LCVVADIATNCDRVSTGAPHFVCFRLHGALFEVRQHDGRAGLRERLRRRESHTCCGPGDERHLTAEVQWIHFLLLFVLLLHARAKDTPRSSCLEERINPHGRYNRRPALSWKAVSRFL